MNIYLLCYERMFVVYFEWVAYWTTIDDRSTHLYFNAKRISFITNYVCTLVYFSVGMHVRLCSELDLKPIFCNWFFFTKHCHFVSHHFFTQLESCTEMLTLFLEMLTLFYGTPFPADYDDNHIYSSTIICIFFK